MTVSRLQAQQQSKVALASTANNPGGVLQRKCACGQHTIAGGECESCQQEETSGNMQRAATRSDPVDNVPPIVQEVLRLPGQPLDKMSRAFFEPRFGHDFSQVRVHTDDRAAESARSVNALAYTVGHHMVFGSGQYRPHPADGQRLLAHELAHVIQQASGSVSAPAAGGLAISDPADALEQAADQTAERIVNAPSAQLEHHLRPGPDGPLPRRLTPSSGTAFQAARLLQRQDDGKKVPVDTITIPPAPRRPPTGLPDPRSIGKLGECRTTITPMGCTDLEALGGPQVQTMDVGGVEDTNYVFSCNEAICIAPANPSRWIILPAKSDYKCGDTVPVCANNLRTRATVVDHRPGYNFYVSAAVAQDLLAPTDAPFQGVVPYPQGTASQWACCQEFNIKNQPGDFPAPDPNERVV